MQVALDATPLTVSTGGISRYTAQLSVALAEEHPEDLYQLLSDQRFTPLADATLNLRIAMPASGWLRRRWWSAGLPVALAAGRFDLFHGTDFAVPYLPVCPTVMTVHDLSPWREAGWHSEADRVRCRAPFLLRSGLATMAITPTEAIRRELCDRFRLPGGRVVAVPLAAARHFQPTDPAPRPRPYFFYSGVLEPRKNLGVLFAAWELVRRELDADLVLAGRRRADWRPLSDTAGLVFLGEVPDADLPKLHSGALATLYPSSYEGFGLPVIEAMQCGAPVVTSRDPAVSEVAGDAALRLDHCDVAAWAEALRALFENQTLRADLSRAGLRRSREFSWQWTARLTRAVYQEAIERFGG